MEGVVVEDVLREPLAVPESHMVILPLGVKVTEGVTEEERVPLKVVDTVKEPVSLKDPVVVEVKHEEGVAELVEEWLAVGDALGEMEFEEHSETPPLRELHRVGVYVPEVLGDALEVKHTVEERVKRPLLEGDEDTEGDPVGQRETLLLSLFSAEEE
jgi:hypothetical protein